MEPLSAIEIRVLGSLVEKDLATPEYYPLSCNALMMACNQKTNREPVVSYDEETVRGALKSLVMQDLVEEIPSARVAKYGHQLGATLNLSRPELALLAVLMLRGPQTPGELRQRTSQMHSFEDTEAVISSLRRMPDGLVMELGRQPGWKENRWSQLLAGAVEATAVATADSSAPREGLAGRVERLEEEVSRLRAEFDELRRQLS